MRLEVRVKNPSLCGEEALVRRGFTLVEIMIVVAIIGLLAAIAIPNFIKFQAKSKQSEAKTNLKGIFTVEKAFFSERDSYENFTGAGFTVERGNRYCYTIADPIVESQARTAIQAPTPTSPTGFDQIQVDCFRIAGGSCTATTLGVPIAGGTSPYVPSTITPQLGITPPSTNPGLVRGGSGSVIVAAVGNVDNDSGNDTWELGLGVTVTLTANVCSDQGTAPTGQPANAWNDAICE